MKLTFLIFLLLFLYIKYSTYENFYYYTQPEESEELEPEEHAEVPGSHPKKKQNKSCRQTVFNNCCPEYHINVHNIKGISNVTTPRLNLTL